MADEAQVRVSLQIRSGNLDYRSNPTAFVADVEGVKGPTPGSLTIPVGGKSIDMGELTTPGFCWMTNLDDTNYVEYGVYDPDTDRFYPLGEILPGEVYILRLARNLQEEYEGTGTGTSGPNNRLFFKANTADVNVRIEAFEK